MSDLVSDLSQLVEQALVQVEASTDVPAVSYTHLTLPTIYSV